MKKFCIVFALLCAIGCVLPTFAAEVDCDSVYCFSPEDFSAKGQVQGICVTKLPDPAIGTVMLGNTVVRSGDILSAETLNRLTFVPLRSEEDQVAQLTYLPIYENRVEKATTITLSVWGKIDKPPVAKDSSLETYKNIPNANIVIQDAYRSFEEQQGSGSSTPAGYSDFHTGLSFRLKDGGNPNRPICDPSLEGKYNWLYENAHKYGFIVRYPESKKDITGIETFEQVFRYVGVAHATYIKSNNLCLEEYLELLRTTYTYDNPLSIKGADGKSYQVYYAAADENSQIMVSSKYGYEISGDNMNGYIVTVNKAARSSVKTTASE